MTAFITQILQKILARDKSISEYTFILPSKRAGSFLIEQISKLNKKAIFSPKILSIEDFVEEISAIKSVDNTTALFEFYAVYAANTEKDKTENFETFASWAQTLLYDFNEIDRYLIDYKSFFGYLSEIQEINHWYLQEEKTPLMRNYLLFWKKLPQYYEQLTQALEKKNFGYQGMVYKKAAENITAYLSENENPHIFIGFNALNNAELTIVQKMLEKDNNEIFWDIDEVFFKDTKHDASLFLRNYNQKWPYYKEHKFNKISNDFSKEKQINMVGIPKNVGQAKYVGELLSGLSAEELKDTAVVLGDENLLLPVLNSIPPNVKELNITMGFPLKNTPVSFLFDRLLQIHAAHQDELYYKDVIAICDHPLVQKITAGASAGISEKIKKENLIFLSEKNLSASFPEIKKLLQLFFGNWENKPALALNNLRNLIFLIKEKLDKDRDKLELEFLFQFNTLFNSLGNLLESYPYISSIKGFSALYRDLLASKTVDFQGKPFSGLQIMGMLESRVLDFKNVILTSVNEGVLPAGKSANSFIPYDLKCSYGLPTYKEKDAVYTYHFYHLLQRAQNVHLLYSNDSEGFNAGEKSRFLLQLDINRQKAHEIRKYNISPEVPAIATSLQVVEKTPEIISRLKKLANHGFSPSALSTYIRNPIDFYHQYVLGIKEQEEVEETIAFNTLGTVVHDTLELFYKEQAGAEITADFLKDVIQKTPKEVAVQFQKSYSKAGISHGKNLIIFEVAKRYVLNLLKLDLTAVENGNSLNILQIEQDLKSPIPIENLDFPIFLKGKVDRVDELNGQRRIIDYKTGKVTQNQVELVEWDKLTTDYDLYGKTFQILTYAWMINIDKSFQFPVEAGIITFKNLKAGFLKFCKKDKAGKGAKKNTSIDQEILDNYQVQVKKLIQEIFDPEIPFLEKEIIKKF